MRASRPEHEPAEWIRAGSRLGAGSIKQRAESMPAKCVPAAELLLILREVVRCWRTRIDTYSLRNSFEARKCGRSSDAIPLVLCLADEVGAAGRDLGPDVTGVWAVLDARRLPCRARSLKVLRRLCRCDGSQAWRHRGQAMPPPRWRPTS